MSTRKRLFFFGAIALLLVLALARHEFSAQPRSPTPDAVESLRLPVARTADLRHVEPERFAVALGRDPERVFRFVRDQVAYEVYRGCLRGPRGALLALAGNSVDQADLLAELLRLSGQRVRYARGELSAEQAQRLVDRLWVRDAFSPSNQAVAEPPSEVASSVETMIEDFRRNLETVRRHLERAGHRGTTAVPVGLEALVSEARDHYWVQLHRDGDWLDLDPSFPDAALGKRFATPAETFDRLPEALHHRVEVRIRLEEHSGARASTRVILRRELQAKALSGRHLVLTHQPEGWTGPVSGLAGAVAASIADTGRVKPVVVLGEEEWQDGEAFRQKMADSGGLSAVSQLLAGAGTRTPVPVATAELLELELIAPDGARQTVTREIFDRLGKAGRESGADLSAAAVSAATSRSDTLDVSQALYSVYFTNGTIRSEHLAGALEPAEPDDLLAPIRALQAGFVASSDALLAWGTRADGVQLRCYPDSPRIHVAELIPRGERVRFALDLRRDHVRVLTTGYRPEDAFAARVVRGVLEGALERALVEYATGPWADEGWLASALSTSHLFERARATGVPTTLLSGSDAALDATPDAETRARLREELERGLWAVLPERPLALAEGDARPRQAWWRIDPISGETVAVTDEGLHQTSIEAQVTSSQREGDSTRVSFIYVRTTIRYGPGGRNVATFPRSFYHVRDYVSYINYLLSRGAVVVFV